MKTYYHVTKTEHFNSIIQHGLLPLVGPLSRSCDEPISRIYLFPNLQTMEDALASWLGVALNDEYGEDTKFCSLKITLPDDFPITEGETPYEVYSYNIIPSKYITYLKDE